MNSFDRAQRGRISLDDFKKSILLIHTNSLAFDLKLHGEAHLLNSGLLCRINLFILYVVIREANDLDALIARCWSKNPLSSTETHVVTTGKESEPGIHFLDIQVVDSLKHCLNLRF
jgi:hypothetical protein